MEVPPSAFDLAALIRRQRPGYSLARPFYTSSEIFSLERRGWLAKQWFILAHSSEIGGPRSYVVRDLLGESIVLVRDEKGFVRGLHNVCRHRGSRICDADGQGTSLVCPYHAWSYRLDGTLRGAPALSADIDKTQLRLKAIATVEVGGLIFGSLEGEASVGSVLEETFEAGLQFHGIDRARIAARRRYPTHGNWKLVLENFVECYHCYAAHPEYCSVMGHVEVIAKPASAAVRESWQGEVDVWWDRDADKTAPLQRLAGDAATIDVCAATRAPIGKGKQTQSEDGLPVAPLMGRQTKFDGGVSVFRREPFIFLAALNDHAVMFQFAPLGAEHTDVTVTWLVDAKATEDDVHLDRMLWLWDKTTIQDKILIERNAEGIRSQAYEPGPYTELENMSARFVARYLQELPAASRECVSG